MWPKFGFRLLFAVAALSVLANAALLTWLVLDRDGSSPRDSDITEAAARSGAGTGPVAVSAKGLRTLAAALGQPIYWAGARPGYNYSLRQTPEGQFYIRYLPPGVGVDDMRSNLLIVATYPLANAFAELERKAREGGAVAFALARGGVAYYREQSPTNVHLAYPGSNYQVEVFDPSPVRARQLIVSGRIVPVPAP